MCGCFPPGIAHIDTLMRLDQWIPFGSNRKELPIYKYHFDDPERHQLYLGSQTGRVLQFTSRKERVWACFSAIPHWVYFTRLRQELQTWWAVVKWAAGIGCGMVILGFVFGLVAAIFAFSGLMSLEDLPDFLRKGSRKIGEVMPREPVSAGIGLDAYTLDYRTSLALEYRDVHADAWRNGTFGDRCGAERALAAARPPAAVPEAAVGCRFAFFGQNPYLYRIDCICV